MSIKIDHNKVRLLFEEINRKLFLLGSERKVACRREIIDYLTENSESELIKLAKILKVADVYIGHKN